MPQPAAAARAACLPMMLATAMLAFHGAAAEPHRSVLLITVDDLRPQLGAYGMHETLTPNVDQFAASALLFQRAYCQMAVCSPSRNSFMSGRRPDTTRVWNFVGSFRDAAEGGNGWVTMPQFFKQAGFLTFGFGKLLWVATLL
jgi:iduronate 2-sulfatase